MLPEARPLRFARPWLAPPPILKPPAGRCRPSRRYHLGYRSKVLVDALKTAIKKAESDVQDARKALMNIVPSLKKADNDCYDDRIGTLTIK